MEQANKTSKYPCPKRITMSANRTAISGARIKTPGGLAARKSLRHRGRRKTSGRFLGQKRVGLADLHTSLHAALTMAGNRRRDLGEKTSCARSYLARSSGPSFNALLATNQFLIFPGPGFPSRRHQLLLPNLQAVSAQSDVSGCRETSRYRAPAFHFPRGFPGFAPPAATTT